MIFKRQAEDDFKVKAVTSAEMEAVITRCANVYRGFPDWVDADDNIKTVNFAEAICSETARLATLAIGIQIDGSARATWLQEQIEKIYFRLRDWVEYGCAYGSVILKPNGTGFDVFTPLDFVVTDQDNMGINGVIFKDTYADGDRYYTRLEYHRFEGDAYYISNRAYMSRSADGLGDHIPLASTKWADLMDDTPPITKANGERLDGPMFGLFRTPKANNVDLSSPLGLSIFREALKELEDLDVAYSRNALEIKDSQKIILADDQLMYDSGRPVHGPGRPDIKLPHYVKNVFGNGTDTFYQEINPAMNTEQRITGINALLSQIGYKCGYSNGYFVFNEKSGMVTATQVESDDRRTIQLIKDVRDKLESCLNGAIYAMSVYADLYGLSPAGVYEVVYDFGDIVYSYEQDKATWWNYVVQGKVPFWYYLTKFENFSKEEAKALEEEARPKEPKLFDEE